MEKRFKVLQGGKAGEDIYEVCKRTGTIDINGNVISRFMEDPQWDYLYDDYYELLCRIEKAWVIIREITDDPLEIHIAGWMFGGYTDAEIAGFLLEAKMVKRWEEGFARIKWFMRKIEGWRRRNSKIPQKNPSDPRK
ncbi:MAG: hypothetical protein N3G78_01375 [Desulfobacterota bacterium]|nr:hypothetical protein [Thermodesulfobacteriota bacterium]